MFQSQAKYKLEGHFSGHREPINCLAITDNGSFMASGGKSILKSFALRPDNRLGDEGTKIWDLKAWKEVPTKARKHDFRDPVSSVAWVTAANDDRETLCFGTGLGYLILWRQQAKQVRSI